MADIYDWIKRAQEGDSDAKEKLLEENSGLIWSIVKRFYGRAESEDLFQIGAIGLLKSIEKFDFSYQVKFSTYAVPMILGEIRRFLRDDGTVKISRTLKELFYRAKKMQEQSLQENNKELSILELAKNLKVEKEELVLAMESGKEIESIYAFYGDGEEKNGLSLLDKLIDNTENEKMMDRIALKDALEDLNPQERQIIMLRYFQDKTQMEVAKKIGISQVQVSRMEKKILYQMKKSLE